MKHEDTCITSILVIGNCVALGFGIAFLVQSVSQISYAYNLWWWALVYCIIIGVSILNQIVKWILTRTEVVEETNSDSNSDDEDALHTRASKRGKKLFRHVYSVKNPIDTLVAVASFGAFIWGCYVYARLGPNGSYTDDVGIHVSYNNQLWVWFQVMFWLLVALLCLACCCLSCIGCLACCAVITGADPVVLRQRSQV